MKMLTFFLHILKDFQFIFVNWGGGGGGDNSYVCSNFFD